MKNNSNIPVGFELNTALSIIELEERHEMTTASQALSCGDNTSCNTSCGKTKTPAAS